MATNSYCIIENVTNDMVTAVNIFTSRQEDLQSNKHEVSHLDQLYRLCKEFVEEYEEYLDDKEQYIEDHSF